MAAETNEENLQRVILQLIKLEQMCRRDSHIQYRTTEDCKELLKPWPKKKEKQEPRPSTESVKISAEVKPEPELRIVEEALERAQKLHHQHDRIMKKMETDGSSLSANRNIQSESNSHTIGVLDDNPNYKMLNSSETRTVCNKTNTSRNTNAKSKTVTSVENKRLSDQRNSSIACVPQSKLDQLVGKPKSSHMPVHLKAPFKTAPAIKRPPSGKTSSRQPRPRSSGSISSVTRVSSGREKVQQLSAKRRTSTSDAIKKATSGCENISISDGSHSSKTSTLDSQQTAERYTVDAPEANRKGSLTLTERVKSSQEKNHKAGIAGKRSKEPQPLEPPTEPPFCLRSNGSKLVIPGKLKKLYSKNRQLRNTAHVVALTVDIADNTQHKRLFMERLQEVATGSDHQDDDLFLYGVQLGSAYRCLQEQLEETIRNIRRIHMAGDVKQILKWKKTLEFVRKAFSDMEQTYNTVSQNGLSIAKHDLVYSKIREKIQKNRKVSHHGMDYIYDALPLSSCRLKYKNRRSLLKHAGLQFEAIWLELQRHLLGELSGIHNYYLNDAAETPKRQLVDTYRAAYSMLCHGGSIFPAVVEDHIEYSDDENDV